MNIQKLEKFQNLLKQKELSGIFVLNYVDFIYFHFFGDKSYEDFLIKGSSSLNIKYPDSNSGS